MRMVVRLLLRRHEELDAVNLTILSVLLELTLEIFLHRKRIVSVLVLESVQTQKDCLSDRGRKGDGRILFLDDLSGLNRSGFHTG